jgi:Tfp pilus assembly protein PilV
MRERISKLHKSQKGFGLAETLVAVAILGTSVVAFVVALSTGLLSVSEHEQETIAQRLALNQMEYTKSLAFSEAGAYPLVATPDGYTITLDMSSVPDADINMQKLTATVLRDGSDIFEVSWYKVNR